ncbi:MAG: hypothetical protein JWN38_1195 [Candidatus Saccharibacteria bacterium]|nr:hypothetical protein [Candidatus Saccharibacteria bacterium]
MIGDASAPILSQQLLVTVAEQLKMPLLQLARQAELGQLAGKADLAAMQTTADTALRLIDNYVLGVRLSLDQDQLELEPISVSSVLYDSGHELSKLARGYGVDLELHVGGRYSTVMANRHGLQSALVSLGAALIEALPALEVPQLKLQLAAHRCRYGIVAGLYSETEQLTSEALRGGRALVGASRQPLGTLTHTAGAGVFVADAILKAMQLTLKASRHHNLYGLGTTLQPNHQLQLI